MKKTCLFLLLLVSTNLWSKDYIFTADEKFITSVVDTIKFDGPQIEVYRDAKVWMVEQKWTANVTKDSLGEGFEFDVNMVTKARYNPIIRTSYSDYITFVGTITLKNNLLILRFDNIQFGETVKGIGSKSVTQPLAQKIYKMEKEKKARAKTENDLTMDKKLQKKELAKHDETIKDIESSLDEVDEELRLKIQLLQKAIQ